MQFYARNIEIPLHQKFDLSYTIEDESRTLSFPKPNMVGPIFFSALHISREYLYFIKLKRNSPDLEYDSHIENTHPSRRYQPCRNSNENQLRNALEEMKKGWQAPCGVGNTCFIRNPSVTACVKLKRERCIQKIVAQSGRLCHKVLRRRSVARKGFAGGAMRQRFCPHRRKGGKYIASF